MQNNINNYSRNSHEPIYNLVFDWGNTLMRADLPYEGPMAEWAEVFAVPGIKEGLPKLKDYPNLLQQMPVIQMKNSNKSP